MRRVVRCPFCNGVGSYEVQKKVFFNMLLKNEKKQCPNCSGTGKVEHIQSRCKVCGQFVTTTRFHRHHKQIVEV